MTDIDLNKRYCVLSFGGCVSCLVNGMKPSPSLSPQQAFLSLPFFGLGANGGHAEYTVVDADALVPVVSPLFQRDHNAQSEIFFTHASFSSSLTMSYLSMLL